MDATEPVLDSADHLSILHLISAYGLAIYDGDIGAWVDTFTPDGSFSGSLGNADGHEELREFLTRMKSDVASNTRDYTSNTVLRPLQSGNVEETSYVMTVRKDQQPIVIATGMYFGELTKTDGRWRFTRRHLDVDPNYQVD